MDILFIIILLIGVASIWSWFMKPKISILSTIVSHHHPIGIGKKIWFFITTNMVSKFFSAIPLIWPLISVIPLIWPLRIVPIFMRWTVVIGKDQIMDTFSPDYMEKLADFGLKPENGNRKYHKIREFPGIKDWVIAERAEWVFSLYEREQVTYVVEVNTIDSYKVFMIITLMLKVIKPMGTITIPDFKMYGEKKLETILDPWARGNATFRLRKEDKEKDKEGKEKGETLDSILSTNATVISDKENGICFRDNEGKESNLIDYLNKLFYKFGCYVEEVDLNIVPGTEAYKFLEIQRQTAEKGKEKELVIAEQGVLEERLKMKKMTVENENQSAASRLKVFEDGISLVDKIYKNETELAGAQPGVLVKFNDSQTAIGTALVKEILKNVYEETQVEKELKEKVIKEKEVKDGK